MNFATTTNGLIGSLMLVWAIGMLGLTICLVIWGVSLWHVITFHDVPNRRRWMSIVMFVPIIGAAIYYLFALLPYNRTHPYIRPKAN